MRRITLADRLRYRFDNTISRGTVALIGWLFVLLLALVFASSLVVYTTGVAPEIGGRRPGFLETLWLSLMRTIDPGGVGEDKGNWPFLLSMLTVTAGGDSRLQHADRGHFHGHRQ
jgi:ion channel POLLUX/CASTOR